MAVDPEELYRVLHGNLPIFGYIPRPIQEEAHRSKADSVAVKGGNQCVTFDTLIPTSRGLLDAGEVREGDRVVGGTVVRRWVSPEPVPVYEARFEGGLRLRGNATHPLRVGSSWRDLSNLVVGRDRVRTSLGPWPWEGGEQGAEAFLKEHTEMGAPIHWVKVLSVEPAGEALVVGHSVDPTNTYTTAGLHSHNSGKTTWLCAEVPSWCCGFRPFFTPDDPDFWVNNMVEQIAVPNVVRIVCSDFKTGLMRAVWPKFKALWPSSWYDVVWDSGYPTTIVWKWGSELHFMSRDQEVEKFESATFHGIGYDEPPDRQRLIASRRGLMATAGREAFSLTPIGQTYLDDALDNSEFVEVFNLPTEDNIRDEDDPNSQGVLHRRAVERFTELQTDIEKAIRTTGDTSVRRGRVMKKFVNREPYICKPYQIPLHWFRIAIIDPHERKPDAVLWWACDPDLQDSCIYDEVMDESTQGSIAKTAATMRAHEITTGAYPNRTLVDPRAAQKNLRESGRTIQQAFFDEGRRVEPAPGVGVDEGFKAIDEWFTIRPETERPRMQIFSTCVGLIEELMLLRWKLAPSGMEYDKRALTVGKDDFVACLRYLLMWNPRVHDTTAASRRFDSDDVTRPIDVMSGGMNDDPGDGTWSGV